jgi:SagB-type dehydrogenase family enzyme
MGIGREFQRRTRYIRGAAPEGTHVRRPDTHKSYPQAPVVRLPDPSAVGGMGLWDALKKRRSGRAYTNDPLTGGDLSQLLWAACGVSDRAGGFPFRTAPSAGALFPIETYVGAARVTGIAAGLYHFDARGHALSLLREGDLSGELARAALDQAMVGKAAAVFLFSAVFDRSAVKYLERAYRYVYLDAGHIVENLLVAATALGLSACPIAALFDEEVNAVLGIDGEDEGILYMASVGRPA